MEGLEISEVCFKDIDLGDRYDAEYFFKEDINSENLLLSKQSLPLDNFGEFVASAFYPSATELYSIGDIPFMRCVDAISFPFITSEQDELFEKLPLQFINEQKGIHTLNKGDIVITKVGSPCFASIIEDIEFVALSRTVLGIKNIHGIDPYYLLVFLRSKYGFKQLLRERELTIQYQLTLDRVKKILVFTPSDEFQKCLSLFIQEQNIFVQKSKLLYAEAENILLKAVGLAAWKPTIKNNNTKTLKESFLVSGRIDAEYYQPKYDELSSLLTDTKPLGEIVSIKKSIEPGSDAYQTEGLSFIRVADLSKNGISQSAVYLDEIEFGNEDLYPKKNTILLSKDGSVGIAYKVEEDVKSITSSAILHLTVIDKDFLPDYLALVINSIVVKLQAERDAGGSIIQHWKPDEIKQVVIPKLDNAIQVKIAEKIQESFLLQKQSKELLEAAKKAVEIAIEQDEKTALTYLENFTNG